MSSQKSRRAPSSDAPSSVQAAAFFQALVDSGVRDVVVCPGSRSQALALVAAAAERDGVIRVHVRVDERSAGFLALGLARGSGRPVPVVVTSGSAVANLWPAVIEAHHDGVPLVVVSADRPDELLGVGANQTTRQAGLFGFAVRGGWSLAAPSAESVEADAALAADVAREAVALSLGEVPGPVHVNLAYREPLSGGHPAIRPAASTVPAGRAQQASLLTGPLLTGRPTRVSVDAGTIVVAGSGAGVAAARFAAAARVPLIAEVVSGARDGDTVVPQYRRVLRGELGERVHRVIVFGRPTLSREVQAVVSRPGVEVVVVDPARPEPFSPRPDAVHALALRFDAPAPAEWVDQWRAAGGAPVPDDARVAVAQAVWQASIADGGSLYVAASAMVRVLDEWVAPAAVPVFANRGLAGIDGTVSTAIGVSLTQQGVTRALVGDLAFLHDVGGLLRQEAEPFPPVQFVVVNDRGGSIFRGLEVAGSDPQLFRRVVETPHTVDVASVARAYGWPYLRVEALTELPGVLAPSRPGIVEVPLD